MSVSIANLSVKLTGNASGLNSAFKDAANGTVKLTTSVKAASVSSKQALEKLDTEIKQVRDSLNAAAAAGEVSANKLAGKLRGLEKLRATVSGPVSAPTGISGLKKFTGEGSKIGNLSKMAVGAGALAGVALAARAFEDLASGIKKVSDMAREGAGVAEIARQMTLAVPILGSVYNGLEQIALAITGIDVEIKRLDELNKALDKDRDTAARMREQVVEAKREIRDIRSKVTLTVALAGTSNVAEQARLVANQAWTQSVNDTNDACAKAEVEARKAGASGTRSRLEVKALLDTQRELRDTRIGNANVEYYNAMRNARDSVVAPFTSQLKSAADAAAALQAQLARPMDSADLAKFKAQLDETRGSLAKLVGSDGAVSAVAQLAAQFAAAEKANKALNDRVSALNEAKSSIEAMQKELAGVGKTALEVRIDWMKQMAVPPQIMAQLKALQQQLDQAKAATNFQDAMNGLREQLDELGKTPIEIKVSAIVKDMPGLSATQVDEYRKALEKLDAAETAKRLAEQLATPAERAQKQLDELDKALAGGLSAEKYAAGVAKVQEELAKAAESQSFSGPAVDQLASAATSVTASNRLDEAFRNQQARLSDSSPKSAEAKRQKTAEEANRLLARMEKLLKDQSEPQILELSI
jgi:hypothetical protein